MSLDAPDTGLFTPLEFAPTRRRQNLLTAVLLALGGLALAWYVDDALHGAALPWRLLAATAVLVPASWLALTLWRQAGSRQPVLRLDARGVSGAALQPPIPWDVLEDAILERGGTLCLHRRPDAAHPDRPAGWLRRNPARPRVSLRLLSTRQQDIAHDAIHARLDVLHQRAGNGPAASRREAQAEEAFEQQLDSLVPTPWALYAMVTANAMVWAMNVAAGLHPLHPLSPDLFAWGANAASAVVLEGQWWRLLTATFLHGGVLHLVFNMLGLWEAGKQLCRLLGNGQFLLVYLASGLAASAASLHFAAQNAVSVGASGAVFGVLGALMAAAWQYRHLVPPSNLRRLWTGLGFFVGYSLLHGFTQENVDNAAHVGGLVCGLLMGAMLPGPIDPDTGAARRAWRAALAGSAAAAAVAWSVLATPLPPAWQAQRYAAQQVLPDVARRIELAFRQLALEGRRLRQGEIREAAFLMAAERAVGPTCEGIADELAPLQLPLWEPLGRMVPVYRQLCDAATRSLQLQAALQRRDPAVPADAGLQLQRLSLQMDQGLRQLALGAQATVPAIPLDRGDAPPPPSGPWRPAPGGARITLDLAALSGELDAPALARAMGQPALNCAPAAGGTTCTAALAAADGVAATQLTAHWSDGRLSRVDILLPWWAHHAAARALVARLGAPSRLQHNLDWDGRQGRVSLVRAPGWWPWQPAALHWDAR